MFDRIRQFRAMLRNPTYTKADIATFAVLAFGIPDREGIHPSETTLAAYTRSDKKTVRHALRHLAELGALTINRQYAGRRIIGTLYQIAGLSGDAKGESAPHHASAVEEIASVQGGVCPLAMEESAPPIDPPVNPVRIGQDMDLRKDTARPQVLDLETEQLCREVQQRSAGPWRLANARREVLAAIDRAGLDAVRQLAAEIRGAGLRAYQITAQLAALGGVVSRTTVATSTPVVAPGTITKLSPLERRAIALIESEPPTVRNHWHRLAQRAGADAPMPQLRLWVPAIAAAYMEAEHQREWLEMAA